VTALATATGLDLPVAANTAYTFSYHVLFQSAAAGTGIGLAVTGPAGGTVAYTVETPLGVDGTAYMFMGAGTAYDDFVLSTAVPAANTTYVAHVYGVIHTAGTAGNLSLRFRSEVGGSTVTVKTDSWGALEVG
jgi:hypothetical protein